jgi:predicted N-acyltransferase
MADVFTSIDQVDPAEWDALAGQAPFLSHRWLRFTEAALMDRRHRVVLVRRHGQLIAAATCTLEPRFEQPMLQRRAGWLARLLPTLRCAVPIAYEAGLVLTSSDGVAELMTAIRQVAWRERALLTTISNLSAENWRVLAGHGCRPLSHWSGATLDINWSTFEAYLASRPRKDRQEIGRMQRRAERDGITVGAETLDVADAQRARQLIQNVLDRHQATDVFATDLLGRTLAMLGDAAQVIVARQSGRLIGCTVLLRDHNEALVKWLGLDYTRTWNTATYHMLLRESIAQAIERGIKRLRLGATAYSTKEQFGVHPDERLNALVLPFVAPRWSAAYSPDRSRGLVP